MQTNQTARFIFDGHVTDVQKQFFEKNGFLHFKNFVSKVTVTGFLQELRHVEKSLLASGATTVNGIPLKFGNDMHGNRLIQRIAFASHYSAKLRDFLHDSRLSTLLCLLGGLPGRIGENEKDGLVINHYVRTPSSKFTQLGWHTDSPRDLFLGSSIRPMLNIGLHLDDCPVTNGGLRVIPGTHKQTIFGLFFRKKYYVDNTADKNEIGFDIEAGDLTIHDGRLWHRVQQSPLFGEASTRRVMYVPVVTGAYQPKSSASATPFYHKVAATIESLKSKIAASRVGLRHLSR